MPRIYKPRPGRWFRLSFSLNATFVVLVLFGVWLGVQAKWIHERRRAITLIDRPGELAKRAIWIFPAASGEPSAPWPIRILGERGIAKIVVASPEAELPGRVIEIRRQFPEAEVFGMKLLVAGSGEFGTMRDETLDDFVE